MTTKPNTTRRASKASKASERTQTAPNEAKQGADTLTPDKSNAAQRPDIEPAFWKSPEPSTMLIELWRKAAPAMTESELAWVAGAGMEVSESLHSITRLLTNISTLACELKNGSHPLNDYININDLLFQLTSQLDVLSTLSFLSGDAVHRLIKPSMYRAGGLFQST